MSVCISLDLCFALICSLLEIALNKQHTLIARLACRTVLF